MKNTVFLRLYFWIVLLQNVAMRHSRQLLANSIQSSANSILFAKLSTWLGHRASMNLYCKNWLISVNECNAEPMCEATLLALQLGDTQLYVFMTV